MVVCLNTSLSCERVVHMVAQHYQALRWQCFSIDGNDGEIHLHMKRVGVSCLIARLVYGLHLAVLDCAFLCGGGSAFQPQCAVPQAEYHLVLHSTE